MTTNMKAQVKLEMEQEDERSSIQAGQAAEQNEVREGKHTNGRQEDKETADLKCTERIMGK